MMHHETPYRMVAAIGATMVTVSPVLAHPGDDDPYADQWIAYDPGENAAKGYTKNPDVVLGSPERFTGEGIFPGVVSAFNPAFGTDEILSIGRGGHIIVSFDRPVTDDPANPFGIDLLIFGNTGFIDDDWPNGIVGGMFDDGGLVEVSIDGVDWFPVKAVEADGLFPTIGYLDSGPYDERPGSELTDFTLPVDPSLALGDFLGLNYDEILDLYGGSGGGVGVDLAEVGLDAISFVRVFVPDDDAQDAVEIDAFSDVAAFYHPADLNMDGSVGVPDLLILLASWGPCPDPPADCPADLDGDGSVGVSDLLILLAAWG